MGTRRSAFSGKVAELLKHYVYLYIDPRTGKPFYVGKGVGGRCYAHTVDRAESEKSRTIAELRKLKLEPRIEFLKWGLSEDEALLVESTAIDLLGLETLTNRVRGYGSRHGARGVVEDVAAMLAAKPAVIVDPVILINIRREFRPGIDTHQLYDATRSAWKVAPPKRDRAKFALAVYRGIVREVYEISNWVRGGSTMHSSDPEGRTVPRPGRWEFVGQVAAKKIRDRYYMRSVEAYFKPGAQNPILYQNCG